MVRIPTCELGTEGIYKVRGHVGDCVGESCFVQPAENRANEPDKASHKQQLPFLKAYNPASLLSLLHGFQAFADYNPLRVLLGTCSEVSPSQVFLLQHGAAS